MGRTACIESQCLYSRATPLLPLWPYGLYRASVAVQVCTRMLPLLFNPYVFRTGLLLIIRRYYSVYTETGICNAENNGM